MFQTVAVCTVKNSRWWKRNCPKHVDFYFKNKFEKLVHLVGFIIRIKEGCILDDKTWNKGLTKQVQICKMSLLAYDILLLSL